MERVARWAVCRDSPFGPIATAGGVTALESNPLRHAHESAVVATYRVSGLREVDRSVGLTENMRYRSRSYPAKSGLPETTGQSACRRRWPFKAPSNRGFVVSERPAAPRNVHFDESRRAFRQLEVSRSAPSVPRPFDDKRKTQDIVVRARGTFRAFRHDKAPI